jgi:acetyl esterase
MSPLHPQARALLDAIASAGAGDEGPRDLSALRRLESVEATFFGHPQPVYSVRDERIDGPGGPMRIRLYEPGAGAPGPAVLFIHGGGWALGGIEMSDHVCRALCRASHMVIASVDYRLAPENPFPAALDDSFTALQWLRANADAVAVCGDSAGGNLAAAVALKARDSGIRDIALQVLIYPALDPTLADESFERSASGYGLTRDDMRYFWDLYLASPADASNPYASPSQARDVSGLAAAFIVTAEYDPLVGEGEKYARRLRELGVKVRLRRFDGMIHGFVGYLGAIADAQIAIDDVARALKDAMAGQIRATVQGGEDPSR